MKTREEWFNIYDECCRVGIRIELLFIADYWGGSSITHITELKVYAGCCVEREVINKLFDISDKYNLSIELHNSDYFIFKEKFDEKEVKKT